MTFPRAVALSACLGLLVACKPADAPVGAQLFHGSGDVRVLDARLVPSGDASAQTGGGTIDYVVARVELTNDLGRDLTPDIDHFFLIDTAGNRFAATESGASALLGISNSHQLLLMNEKRVYTIGFRTNDPSVAGTIEYQP
jgi:hypothetical protein